MKEWGDWARQFIVGICMAAGLYAGVRADLATLHEKAANAQRLAERAHDRIDVLREHREVR